MFDLAARPISLFVCCRSELEEFETPQKYTEGPASVEKRIRTWITQALGRTLGSLFYGVHPKCISKGLRGFRVLKY